MSAESIASLFNGDVSDQVLQDLELAMVEKRDSGIGDVDSLDILLNIALREDDFGNQAERIVFNAFIGQLGSNSNDVDEISTRCLKFYQLMLKSTASLQLLSKLHKLSHLSYMAGTARQAKAEEKEEIASFFPVVIPQVSQEQLNRHDDVWCTQRMVSTDEIDASLKVLESRIRLEPSQSTRDFSINFPINLYGPETIENMLVEQLLHQKEAFAVSEPDHPFKKINIFPVNHGNHWMLFVAYPVSKAGTPGKLAVVVFSSIQSLTDERKEAFAEAATMLGAGRVTYVEKNLQEHMCNSCGVLVVEAVSQILANRDRDPTFVVPQFAQNFQTRSKENREAFNIGRRHEMLGDYIAVNRR